MKNLRLTSSFLAIALLAVLATAAPVARAQLAVPPMGVVAPRVGSTITGTGIGQSVTVADARAAANLAAERARVTRSARGPIFWGPVTTQRTLTPGAWPFYQRQYQTVMTQTWSY